MTFKTVILTAAASAALAFPLGAATAQVAAGVGADVTATTPANSTLGTVSDTVDKATDTAAGVTPEVSAEAGVQADAGDAKLVAVTEADIKTGDTVRDTAGAVVGKIESVSTEGAVIATGKSRVQIPVSSFGKNDKGLVIAMTKAELEAAASAKSPS